MSDLVPILEGSNGGPRPVVLVLLTWNALPFTKQCYRSIRATAGADVPYRLVFIDNGSVDGSVDWLRELAASEADVTVVENPTNLGFTKGVNQGIAESTAAEDIILINNDIRFDDDGWIARLQQVAYAEPGIAVVGSRLIDQNGLVNHLGAYMQPVGIYGQQLGGNEKDVGQGGGLRDVEAVIFALAYLTRAGLDALGGLDEGLFAYFEDTDYCLRARRAGMRIVYCGDVSPVHFHNTSTRENKVDIWGLLGQSREYFSEKWGEWLDDGRYDVDVRWRSVAHSPLGYAVGSRQLMEQLHYQDVRVSFENAYGATEPPTGHALIDDFMVREPRDSKAIRVSYSQADAFKRRSTGHEVGYTMLEVTGLPKTWVDGCNAMDEVWVPASFNVDTFRSSGVTVPIQVMPLGVDDVYFNTQIKGERISEAFTFLSVFEWGERKAPEVLLRAFAQEFSRKENVMLLLSVFNRDPSIDVRAEIAKLDLPKTARIVVMINPEFAGYQMGSLYRSADCFVLPTRGEGWGQPVLEAMACGLPVIATGWSGVTDFLDEEVGFPLEYSMAPAEARCVYYDGFDWAEPDKDHLQARMREVVNGSDVAKKRGALAAQRVTDQFTWRHSAERIATRLREIG
ncbi:glycosyltransferase [Pengzhenrongella sicca]|uniref:Glycosyltransferase n=1 Tax=Pengzhenrongella sicca TaxID=2819238 RepID=A0A8A4ZKX3_9MICO|nr:glycosyltransferase [Pengzhenrongella sicca]QTE30228.1 glycosyltransferase [Pengzhenrongella sicca]